MIATLFLYFYIFFSIIIKQLIYIDFFDTMLQNGEFIMKVTFPVEEDFYQRINAILKEFCLMFEHLGFEYKELGEQEILERLLQKTSVFVMAYNAYLNPDYKLSDLEMTNIAFTLYNRKHEAHKEHIKLQGNASWLKISDPIRIIDIMIEQNSYNKTFQEMYDFCLNNEFYFLIKDKLIYIGIAFSKSKDPLDIYFLNKDNMLPDYSFKYYVDALLLSLNVEAENLKYKESNTKKVIHTFEDGNYWSYVSDISEIQKIGKIQGNELQDKEFALDYNNFREIYFLFNKEEQPLLMASFNRINNVPSAIVSIEGQKIDRIFEPYVDFILQFKEQEDFAVKYNEEFRNIH